MFKFTVETEIVRDNGGRQRNDKTGGRGRKNARENRRRTECQLTVREKARENRQGARKTRKTRGTVTGMVRGDRNCDRLATPGGRTVFVVLCALCSPSAARGGREEASTRVLLLRVGLAALRLSLYTYACTA